MRRIIDNAKKLIVWLFWHAWYASFVDKNQLSMSEFILMLIRTRNPWWKFKPGVGRDNPGTGWEVFLEEADDHHYTVETTLKVSATVDDSGRLKSFRIRGIDLMVAEPTNHTKVKH